MNIQTINFLNRIKNASLSNNETVLVTYSESIVKLLTVLYKEGFIQSFNVVKNNLGKKQFKIALRYYYNRSSLKNLQIVSTPSKVKFLGYNSLTKICVRKNVLFLSTNLGVLTALECKKKKIGGILFFIC